ncbi:unknown protein [Microcystis aeruginosa NIES-843]|uniref:Uncharacterized protein n=1 Tax=Microcystis aeruginosa (strain NIES-843 / IAM M-2473) TaxID=449447 RepID=B0JGB8_MICAN|nr:unknown protein [Microcystis aeruginosa NIES-843]
MRFLSKNSGLFSTWCDNQCLSFVGVLLGKALKTIFLENYRLFSTLCDNFCLWNREMLTGQDF